MKISTDFAFISNLIEKLERQVLCAQQHDYIQKTLVSSVLIQTYQKTLDLQYLPLINRYYQWLSIHYYDPRFTKKELTDLFLLKQQFEKFFYRFSTGGDGNQRAGGVANASPDDMYFEQVKYIAQIWGYHLKKEIHNILEFFSFFAKEVFGIPEHLVKNIVALIRLPWKPIFSPLGLIPQKKFHLQEIDRYFFGTADSAAPYEAHVIADIDRLFSIKNPLLKHDIYLPKSDNFDVFEASLVVHEFQHIIEPQGKNLYESERDALNAERIFLQIMGTGKRGRFCWLESNLFYPILLLKWEIEVLLSGAKKMPRFYQICDEQGMKRIELSSLFDWDTPFHMSAYCASSMDIERTWCTYLRNSRELSSYA